MKLALLLAMLTLTGSANAANWKTIYDAPYDPEYPLARTMYEVDTTSVSFRNGYVQAWVRYSRLPEQVIEGTYPKKYFKSLLELYHFDCIGKDSAISQVLYYSEPVATGDNVHSITYQKDAIPKMMTTVAPGTLGEAILDSICALRGYKK